jgi:small conductance mechanosensitive channel
MHAVLHVRSSGPGSGGWATLTGFVPSAWPALPPLAWLLIGLAALAVAVWLARHLTRTLGRVLDRLDGFEGNNPRLDAALRRVDRFLLRTALLLVPVLAAVTLQAPGWLTDGLLLVLRLYLTLAAGVLAVRTAALAVDVLHAVVRAQAARHGWMPAAERIGHVVPTLRACLEYALWIGLATALALQIPGLRPYAAWGPRLALACLLIFLGRVGLELGYFEIDRRLLLSEGLTDAARRRRATMAPLVRSGWTYIAWFMTVTLVLSAMGFNVMPFLAGAGILGLVIGFGAQSMINDVVSGFFILFENIYLVGDLIQVGEARGTVEAIEFRTTKIRDTEGRLHIIRNGDMKPVINYSRDYGVAVVAVDVSYESDLDRVFAFLRETGAVLHARHPDVLADTEIEGITAFGANALTVRTSTKVKPGRHETVAATLRLMLKQAFDREAGSDPRAGLIPVIRPAHTTHP